MSTDDDPVEPVLGRKLWDALGASADPQLPASFDAGFRRRLGEEQGREVLGDELWNALGAAPEVSGPAWQRPANRPGPGWRTAVAVAVAVAAVFLAMPRLREASTPPAPTAPPLELAMIRDLELAEHLDLLSHPDFDVLVTWDGEVP